MTKHQADHAEKVETDSLGMIVGALNKGLGAMDGPLSVSQIVEQRWNLLHEDLSLPTAVLYEDKLAHNLAWMQQFIQAYGVNLAPHGKTTMAPALFTRQLQTGAWGITLATAHQSRVAYEHGVRRVLMANQLVGKQNMEIVSRLLRDQNFEFYCLVDSAQQASQLGEFFSAHHKRLNVLIELGVDGGRAGIRNSQQLDELLAVLHQWRNAIAVCGVELYEGVLQEETAIRTFLNQAVDLAAKLAKGNQFDRNPAILSGAGSAWYDVVAEVFSAAAIAYPLEIVLRPGCYLTHDVGVYRKAQAQILSRNPIAKKMHSGLLPALQLWAYVQSVPEKETAILTLGKRDAAFDSGLPTPSLHYRPGQATPRACPSHWELIRMMDQHAFMKIAEGDDVRVGDMIGLDISHPCLTFDKWRYLPVLDSSYQVIDLVKTFF
ncbi:MAG: amino acid deaminase [Acidobacteriaceae bacterium]